MMRLPKGIVIGKPLKLLAKTLKEEKLIMAKKAKGNRVQVILECTEHKDSGMPGTSRYITTKTEKILLKDLS